MPIPPVIVELPPDASAHEAAALIEACNKSLPERGCELISPGRDGEARSGVALVRRRGERKLLIELGVLRDRKVSWVLRELEFKADDPEQERWRTVGLVIGTLVGQAEAGSPPEPRNDLAQEPRRAPADTPVARDIRPKVAEWRASLGVDAVAGPALEQESWRLGAGFGGGFRLARSPVFLQLGLRYAATPRDSDGVALSWASAAAGVGVHWDLSRPLKLESTAALVVERVGASATSADTGESDSGARFTAGGRLGLGLLVLPSGFFGIFVGTEGTVLASTTRLVVAGQDAGRVQNPTYGFGLGLRAWLF